MAEEPELKVVKVPMLDTGLGREAGFKDDAELIEHAKKEREAMNPFDRAILEDIERKEEDMLINGSVRCIGCGRFVPRSENWNQCADCDTRE